MVVTGYLHVSLTRTGTITTINGTVHDQLLTQCASNFWGNCVCFIMVAVLLNHYPYFLYNVREVDGDQMAGKKERSCKLEITAHRSDPVSSQFITVAIAAN